MAALTHISFFFIILVSVCLLIVGIEVIVTLDDTQTHHTR
jgi:hypothetical protein